MQSRSWSGSTRLSMQRQLEERGCKCPLRSNSDEADPPENPGCLSSWAERRRRGRSAGAREQAEEGGGFGIPAAANLKPKDDQAAPPAAVELGIGLPALAPGSFAHSKARLGLGAGVWSAIPRNRANQSRIDGELGTMPEREAVAYDLDAPAVVDGHIEVHGRQSNVTTNAGSGFLADPRDGPLDRNGSGGEDARRGTSSTTVTVLIEWASAGAGTRAKRHGEAKAREEEDPKVGRGDGYILGATRASSQRARRQGGASRLGLESLLPN